MALTRRQFLTSTTPGAVGGIAAGAALVLNPWGGVHAWGNILDSSGYDSGGKGKRPMNILILGGTGFLGPHLVESARKRGHTITLFNRGKTNPHLFPGLEKLRGDRDTGDLDALKGRSWDAVIDPSAYHPRVVHQVLDILEPRIGFYLLVSTLSVFADFSTRGLDEKSPLATIEDEANGKATEANYGALKALCEKAAEQKMTGRAHIVRPGLIVGPGDPTDRFTYWPIRIERGGEVLTPGTANDPIQYVDVRDLAGWMIRMTEEKVAGVFNATGPARPFTLAELLYGCKAVTGGDARFTWVDAEFLTAQGVRLWTDLPVWLPAKGTFAGFHRVNCSKALKRGLTFRPLAETVRDTLDWFHKNRTGGKANLRGCMKPDREVAVLKAWHERSHSVTTRPGTP